MDVSGIIQNLLDRYRRVVLSQQYTITGDPGLLREASGRYVVGANQVAEISSDLVRTASDTNMSWDGDAADQYMNSTMTLSGRLYQTEKTLRLRAGALDDGARALDIASTDMRQVIADFDVRAGGLVARARNASIFEIFGLINDAERLGDSAIAAARSVADQLGNQLAGIAQTLHASLPASVNATGTTPGAAATNGQAAGDAVRRALSGDASPDDFRAAMNQLRLVTDDVRRARQSGAAISPEDQAFLQAFYGKLGDKVYDLPGYVQAGEHSWGGWLFGHHEQGFSAGDQQTMLNAAGNGLLTLTSDNATTPQSVRDLLAQPATTTAQGTTVAGGLFLTSDPLPPGQEPLTGIYGEASYNAVLSAPHLQQYEALGTMMHAADTDIVPGKDFSTALTRQTADIADVERRLHDGGSTSDPSFWALAGTSELNDQPRVERAMTDVLDVTTRNHDASAALFDPAVAANKDTLTKLAGYGWSDDGRTVGHLVDWIGPASGDPAQHQLAQTAYVNLTQTMTDTSTVSGHFAGDKGALGSYTMFEQMSRSMTINPHLSEAIATATVPNLDLYAHPLLAQDTNTHNMQISAPDASRMMTLAQFSQAGRDQMSIGTAAYGQYMLDWAQHGPPNELADRMATAGRYAGQVQGMAAATANDAIWYANVDNADARNAAQLATYQHEVQALRIARDFGTFGLGRIPEVGPYVGFAYQQAMVAGMESFTPPPPIQPNAVPFDATHHPLFSGSAPVYEGAYSLAGYQHAAGATVPDAAFQVEPGQYALDGSGAHAIPLAAQVTDPALKENVVAWANGLPGGHAYLEQYQIVAGQAYLTNLHIGSRDEIVNFIQGRRP